MTAIMTLKHAIRMVRKLRRQPSLLLAVFYLISGQYRFITHLIYRDAMLMLF